MWGALLAATMAAWLHQLTAITAGEDILAGHGVRGGKAMIATLRWRLIAVPGRLSPPRPPPSPAASTWPLGASRGAGPAAGTARPPYHAHPEPRLPVLVHGLPPRAAERPAHREPGAGPGCRHARYQDPGAQRSFTEGGSAHRAIRGIGSNITLRTKSIGSMKELVSPTGRGRGRGRGR